MSEINVLSLNVNSDRRIQHGKFANMFPEHSIKNRIFALRDLLFNKEYVLYLLQEIDDEMALELLKLFKHYGYTIIFSPYSTSEFAFYLAVAYKNLTPQISASWYTKSGQMTQESNRNKMTKEEKFDRHLGTEFEKCFQIIKFNSLTILHTHFGLQRAHRLAASQILSTYLAADPVMCIGDMNQFDETSKESKVFMDQINIFKNNGYTWMGPYPEDGIGSTFIAWAYDIAWKVKNINELSRTELIDKAIECNPLSTCMDAIFTKGFELSDIKVIGNINGVFYPDNVKDVLARYAEFYRNGGSFASDHFGLEFTLPSNTL